MNVDVEQVQEEAGGFNWLFAIHSTSLPSTGSGQAGQVFDFLLELNRASGDAFFMDSPAALGMTMAGPSGFRPVLGVGRIEPQGYYETILDSPPGPA